MKRIYIRTLLLFVVIAALSTALAIRTRQVTKLETELQGLRPAMDYDPLWKSTSSGIFVSPEDVVIRENP